MTTPDRASLEASQKAWAHGRQAPDYAPEDTRTHQDELMASHEGRPTVAEQNVTHGAPAPSPDRGTP